jgi:hypothetical protein
VVETDFVLMYLFRLRPECALNLPGMRGQDSEEEKENSPDREERSADGEDNANIG